VDPERLGAWDYKEHQNLSILMPGLYWDDKSRQSIKSGGNLTLKSRGVSGKYLAPFIDTFDVRWTLLHNEIAASEAGIASPDHAPKIEIVVEFGIISPRLAVARNNWATCGQVVWDDKRLISANPEGKRGGFYTDGDLLRTGVRVRVRDRNGDVMERTLPYENRFGAEELEHLEELDELLTQDGTVNDIIHATVSG
jgi:hypothetical protein